MEEGTFLGWKKAEGEYVRAGEPLYELESEKATQEVEAVDSGILRFGPNAPQPGDVIQVGALLGYLVGEGEALPAEPSAAEAAACPVVEAKPIQAATVSRVSESSSSVPAPPSVRRLARELGVELSRVSGSGAAGRVTAQDVRMHNAPATVADADVQHRVASPRARRVAGELGVDWRSLRGTGRTGRIRECDVLAAAQTPSDRAAGSGARRQPVSSRRRTIAQRMLLSRQQSAPVTLTTRADATNMVNLRTQFKTVGPGDTTPTYTDMIVKLTASALERHPLLAARWEDDHLVFAETLDIGIAVDAEAGLIVPVVRDAGRLSLLQLAEQSRGLIEQARSGTLSAGDLRGGAFTITNLGAFGIDAFTPMINLPETAILGVGCIRREPVVYNDQIVPRDQMTLSLTFDHRVVDGAPAARFLQTVVEAIENPSAWLLRNM